MDKRLVLTTVLFSFYFVAFGQFKQNSIGVCYLQKDTTDYYFLTITLPVQTLENTNFNYGADSILKVIDTLAYNGEFIFFDGEGVIFSGLENKEKFLIEFWCDNDGGTQYRPTLRTKIKKTYLKRPLKGIKLTKDICCFILLNLNENNIQELPSVRSDEIALSGDYNQNGKPECHIWTHRADAEDCDGHDRVVKLQVGQDHYFLNCCLP